MGLCEAWAFDQTCEPSILAPGSHVGLVIKPESLMEIQAPLRGGDRRRKVKPAAHRSSSVSQFIHDAKLPDWLIGLLARQAGQPEAVEAMEVMEAMVEST